MSADNVIYIQKKKNKYIVWHDFASNEDPRPYKNNSKKFNNKDSAENYAFELEEEIGYVEYGIQEFGWQKPINWDVIDAVEQFKMKEKLK